MSEYVLSSEERGILERHGDGFKNWKESEIGKKEIRQHLDHEEYFKLKLSVENIPKISKSDMVELYKKLWASRIWSNKDYNINNIIEKNGLDILKKELNLLLYGEEQFEKRYDLFRKQVKGFGISAISEILNMLLPDKFCLWNTVTRNVLTFLNLKKNLPISVFRKKYYITGKEYVQCIDYLSTIKNILLPYQISNFIDLDLFFWYVHENVIPKDWKKVKIDLNLDNKKNVNIQREILNPNQMNTRFWVVRAGKNGEEEKVALDKNVITIGWGVGDNSKFNDKESLKKEFSRLNPTYRKKSIAMISSEIWRFGKEIRIGDIIILPQKLKGKNHNVAIGKVANDYKFEKIASGVENIRPVQWLHKDIPINEFSEVGRKSFNHPPTIYSITKQNEIQSILDIMNKYEILPNEFKNPLDLKSSDRYNTKEDNPFLTLENLSQILNIENETLEEMEELLIDKKQIIFYGPPGTSKTFVGRFFADYFTQNHENVDIVQFHPSYSYEDFIEGIKPRVSKTKEASGFEIKPGIFKNLVKKCIKKPNEKFVLIIDEINRGNISKIFGELIFLLEYREEEILLTYSPEEKFSIPKNLYIIGTMNSADRSIAFVDYALRRRFYFIDFYPDKNMDILSKWLQNNPSKDIKSDSIINLLNEINTWIEDKLGREYQIGYSYFMTKNLDMKKLKRIQDYSIMPLIEQYFFGKTNQIKDIYKIFQKYLTSNQLIDANTEI